MGLSYDNFPSYSRPRWSGLGPHIRSSVAIGKFIFFGLVQRTVCGIVWWRLATDLLSFNISQIAGRDTRNKKRKKITFSCTRGGAAPAGARSPHSTPPESFTRSAGRAGTFDHAGLAPGDGDLTTTTRRRFVLSSSPFVRPRRHDADRGGRGAPSLAGHSPTTPRHTREGIARGRAQVRHRHGSVRAQLTIPETRVCLSPTAAAAARPRTRSLGARP